MPAFDEQVVSDEDLAAIFRYLQSVRQSEAGG